MPTKERIVEYPEQYIYSSANNYADGKFLMTEITLSPTLIINDETKMDCALRILEKSEKACLISNSIKAVVKLDPTVQVGVSV